MGKDQAGGSGAAGGRGGEAGRDLALRRKALEMAAELPADPGEARLVIHYLIMLLNDFIEPQDEDLAEKEVRLRLVSSREKD